MAGAGKPSILAAFIVTWGLAALAPTAAMAQFPIPMIPNFGFGGPQHYRSGSSHYPTHSHSHQTEDKAPVDKAKERDATQPDSTASASTTRTQQTSGPPPSHDAAPSGGSGTLPSPPPAPPAKRNNDDQPAFQPSR